MCWLLPNGSVGFVDDENEFDGEGINYDSDTGSERESDKISGTLTLSTPQRQISISVLWLKKYKKHVKKKEEKKKKKKTEIMDATAMLDISQSSTASMCSTSLYHPLCYLGSCSITLAIPSLKCLSEGVSLSWWFDLFWKSNHHVRTRKEKSVGHTREASTSTKFSPIIYWIR